MKRDVSDRLNDALDRLTKLCGELERARWMITNGGGRFPPGGTRGRGVVVDNVRIENQRHVEDVMYMICSALGGGKTYPGLIERAINRLEDNTDKFRRGEPIRKKG